MNVTLIQKEINCFELLFHTTVNREETLEMIVPDACPDILDIVDTDAAIQLRSKECGAGCLTLNGSVGCSILYQPESGGGLQCLRAELPVQFTSELERLTGQSRCMVLPRVTLAETRVLNPRKVLIRVGLAFVVTAYEPGAVRYCTGVEESESLGVEQRVERQRGSFATRVTERAFTYSDEVQIPGSRPAMAQLLRVRSRAFASETRLIGGKLVFKGGTAIQLLYLSQEEQLCMAEFELPFSQIMDVGETEEGASFQLELTVTGCQSSEEGAEGRTVSLELELLAQAVVLETRELSVVTDAYSIRHAGVPEFMAYQLPRLLEQGTRRQTAREVIETAVMAQEVCEARAFVTQVRVAAGELVTDLRVTVLYLTEEEHYASVSRQIQVKCPAELEENMACVPDCSVPEVDATATTGGIEVRLGVDFQVQVMEQSRVFGLSGFELDTEKPVEQEHQPSVVLRQITEGETLWDIAKFYRTTRAEIEQANGLDGEPAVPGQLLLIPKKR